MSKMVLILYVAGHTSKSERAVRTLYKLFEDEANYELSVIDVLENPQAAENEKILATPTLIRRLPPPVRRIIGDLSDTEKVLVGLDLHETDAFLGAG